MATAKRKRKKRVENKFGWDRTLPLTVKLPWPIFQKLRYSQRKCMKMRANQIVSWALSEWYENHPEHVEGYKPDRKLEESRGRDGFVYLMLAENGLHKIGRSADCKTRLYALKQQEGCNISFIGAHDVSDSFVAERAAHKLFADKRQHGEWFKLTPDDVQKFANLTGDDLHQRT